MVSCDQDLTDGNEAHQAEQKIFKSVEEVKQHWRGDCKAFFMVCTKCGALEKSRGHNCIKTLKEEKRARDIAI